MRRILLSALLLLCAHIGAGAQDGVRTIQGIPADVYYMMPDFGQGMVFFYGQAPAQGKLNICALDHTLRFLDNNGKELEATNEENIVKVQIDTVTFLRNQGIYFRLCPVTLDMGVALRRDVTLLKDVKQGAFGTTSQTSSIKEYGTIIADGVSYDIEKTKEYPYRISETLFLYKGNTVVAFNKRNLRKLFPARKDEIDAWFKSSGSVPDTLPEALAFLAMWAAGE